MDRIFNEDEPVKKCPTCGSEITGISEVFDADGKKISIDYSYGEDSNTNEKEHKFALPGEEEEVKERWPDYTPEELEQEQALADAANKFKIKDYNEHNRDTSKDPFKGTSIEGKD